MRQAGGAKGRNWSARATATAIPAALPAPAGAMYARATAQTDLWRKVDGVFGLIILETGACHEGQA
jgi:hypothetical protein